MRRVPQALAWISVLGMSSLASAFQPPAGERPERAPDRRGSGDQPPTDREGMKTFIRARIEELRVRGDALEKALKRLDEGADPASVRQDLEPARGGGRRGGGGAGGGPGDRPGGVDEAGMPPGHELPPMTSEQAMKFLEEVAPKMGARIRQFTASNPEMAERIIGRMRGKLEELRGIREHDSELFQLKVAEMQGAYDVMDKMRKLRDAGREKATSEETGRLREALKVAIGEHFDEQLAVQQHEVKRLTERLEKLQSEIKDRQQGRERLIDHQVEEALKRPDRGGQVDRDRKREKPD